MPRREAAGLLQSARCAHKSMSCPPRRRSGRSFVIVLLCLLVGAAGVIHSLAPPDPFYKGKHLSEYLYDTAPVPVRPGAGTSAATLQLLLAAQNERRQRAEEAIQALGPKAIPLIASWMKSDAALRNKICKLAAAPGSRLSWLLNSPWLTRDPRAIASDCLARLIPQHAGPVLAILRKQALANQMPASGEAAQLFSRIFEAMPSDTGRRLAHENADFIELVTACPTNQLSDPVVQVVTTLLLHDPPEDSERVVRRLWPFRRPRYNNVHFVISQLDPDGFIRNLLYLEDGTPAEKPDAALYFHESQRAPERIVPLLTANLDPSGSISLLQDVCAALGSYGTHASSALPTLTNLLMHPRSTVVKSASNAIALITVKPQ
jgi:hypothetical protein